MADEVEDAVVAVENLLPGQLVEGAFDYLVPRLNAAAAWTAPEELILARYRREGVSVKSLTGIGRLELETVESVVTKRRFREAMVGAGEGAATGWAGPAGIPVDVVALLMLSLREVNTFAASYGFNRDSEKERAFALSVLGAATAVGRRAKQVLIASLPKVVAKVGGAEVAKQALERLPQQLVVRVTAMKASDAAPILGAGIGAAFNQWYLRRVGRTARFAYRERFLIRRFGEDFNSC